MGVCCFCSFGFAVFVRVGFTCFFFVLFDVFQFLLVVLGLFGLMLVHFVGLGLFGWLGICGLWVAMRKHRATCSADRNPDLKDVHQRVPLSHTQFESRFLNMDPVLLGIQSHNGRGFGCWFKGKSNENKHLSWCPPS